MWSWLRFSKMSSQKKKSGHCTPGFRRSRACSWFLTCWCCLRIRWESCHCEWPCKNFRGCDWGKWGGVVGFQLGLLGWFFFCFCGGGIIWAGCSFGAGDLAIFSFPSHLRWGREGVCCVVVFFGGGGPPLLLASLRYSFSFLGWWSCPWFLFMWSLVMTLMIVLLQCSMLMTVLAGGAVMITVVESFVVVV